MKVSELAKLWLFSDRIEDKLFFPDDVQFDNWTALETTPKAPGRPKTLMFSETKQAKSRFPSLHQLENERARGQALHFFANHELLALELMALTLLKFPMAPKPFLSGILNTAKDEIKHLKFYIEKMNLFGVGFGEITVNDFFWKTLSKIQSPLEYTTGMSLTFEQANLDFSLFYKNAFNKIGDKETADVLNTVYLDEISHVAYGLHWFENFREQKNDFWSEYQDSLNFPLTPMRAKGKVYSIDARKKVGFSDDFIQQLQLYSHSKGRLPRLFYFNPDCEDEWSLGKAYNPSHKTLSLQQDLSFLPAYLAHDSDVILLDHQPEKKFLQKIIASGLKLPEIKIINTEQNTGEKSDAEKASIKLSATKQNTVEQNIVEQSTAEQMKKSKRKVGSFEPWGKTPRMQKFANSYLQNFDLQEKYSPPNRSLFSKAWSAQLQRLFCQKNSTPELIDINSVGRVAYSLDEIIEYSRQFLTMGHKTIVLKAAFGASGRYFHWIDNIEDLDQQRIHQWCINKLQNGDPLICEPWLNKEFDYSLQITVHKNRPATINGLARFLVSGRGAYQGALLGGFQTGLTTEHKKLLNRQGTEDRFFRNFNQEVAEFISEQAQKQGYYGAIGIDAFVYKDLNGELKIKPIVETNCRWNMGRLVVELEKNLKFKGCGIWQVKPYRDSLVKALKENYTELTSGQGQGQELGQVQRQGANFQKQYLIASTSPQKKMLAYMIFDRDFDSLMQSAQELNLESI